MLTGIFSLCVQSAKCPLHGKIRENREFCIKKNPCREKSGNFEKTGKIGENQGILQNHVKEISRNFQPVNEIKSQSK